MEAAPVLRLGPPNGAGQRERGVVSLSVGRNHLDLRITGMGPQLARSTAAQALRPWTVRSAVALAAEKPDAVLVVGLCGGLKESLPGSRLVLYTGCLSTANGQAALECSPSITHRLRELLSSQGMACDAVVGITSARIAVTAENRISLAQAGADVVDMESYEILAAANQAGVPAAVLRVVGDTAARTSRISIGRLTRRERSTAARPFELPWLALADSPPPPCKQARDRLTSARPSQAS